MYRLWKTTKENPCLTGLQNSWLNLWHLYLVWFDSIRSGYSLFFKFVLFVCLSWVLFCVGGFLVLRNIRLRFPPLNLWKIKNKWGMQPAFDVHIRSSDTIVVINRFLLVGWNVAIHNPDPSSARMGSCRRHVIAKFPFPILLFALQLVSLSLSVSLCLSLSLSVLPCPQFTLQSSYLIPLAD